MPNQARSHEDNRKIVCMLCMKKCSRQLTAFQADRIVKIYQTNIDVCDARTPQGICDACRTACRKKDEGKDVTLPPLFDFKSIRIKPATRDQGCSCLICQIGRLKLNEKSPLESNQTSLDRNSQRCGKCLCILGRGLPHQCTESSLRENLKQLASENGTAAEHIASHVISTKDATPGGTVKISQPNGGRPLRVSPGKVSICEQN